MRSSSRADTAKPIFDLPANGRFKPVLCEEPLPARVTFDDVTFRHDGATASVLAGANLSVEPGEIIAITGSNGSGRSTAVQLALGQLVPQSGQVLIDDIPAVMAGTGVCGTLAFVDHHVATIRGTVLNNLTMFRDGEGIEAAEAVANLMGLDEDINRLPRGYHTRLGEAATEALPPGLTQRIVVARAVASRPRLIIIDQANSSFDQRGDRMLARGFSSLKGSVTTILITNQPSLIAVADRVMAIDDGKFVEINYRPSSERAIT
ncbi:MAG: ATP-binding cassette domain-containing protein [Hyphomicrobium sp.]